MSVPKTAAGRLLAEWLESMRRKQYLGVPDPALVGQIEAEAARSALDDAIAAVEGMTSLKAIGPVTFDQHMVPRKYSVEELFVPVN